MAARDDRPPQDATLSLALAVIGASTAPLVLLDAELDVIAASTSFFRTFQVDSAGAAGRGFFALGAGEWDVPQLRSLLEATVSGDAQLDAYELDLTRPGRPVRRLVMRAEKLAYAGADGVRLLLAISDVTESRNDARRKEELAHENALLLREVRHRVANSLQIIASVLLQSARRTQSDEARSHLNNAHHRLMSVATLERHLATATLGPVPMRAYLTKLCASIGASMIRDPAEMTLSVVVDESSADADTSVSLGLIVTELVINALKHAFPERAAGAITVAYGAEGGGWTLSISDDGVGMPTGAMAASAGLGTTIVQALATKLQAQIEVVDALPGTTVIVNHVEADREVDRAAVLEPAI